MTYLSKFKFILLFGSINIVLFACNKSHSRINTSSLPPVEAIDSVDNEISLLFIGDIMQHGPQIKAAYNDSLKVYDYTSCFEPIAPIAKSTDFTIANLELTLAGKPYKGYPQFSAPDNLAVTLKNAGIGYLVTANNHSCDRKSKGVKRTITMLDSLGIKHTGTFLDSADRSKNNPLIIEKNGIRIALLNYTYGTNGLFVAKPLMVNYIDSTVILNDLEACKKGNFDKIIVFTHWGAEYKKLPNNYQKQYAKFCLNNGADYIIGSHPHVLQPMHRFYDSSLQKEQLVVYSLGNFVSNQRDRYKDGGTMFKLVLKKDSTVKIKEAGYILTWVDKIKVKGKNRYTIYPVNKYYNDSLTLSKASLKKMHVFFKDSEKLLQKHNKNIGSYYFSQRKRVWLYTEPKKVQGK
jgi:poly-gamma-glutamate synthesis protein (capsule biosynthesis protein)